MNNKIGLDGIDNEKLEKMLREKNPCCDKVSCEKGDYQILQHPKGVIICQGCMIVDDKKYGMPAVMSKDFEMPNKEV